VFDCCESDLEEFYWRYTYYEIKKRIELRVGYETASHMSFYTAVAEVVGGALGGTKETKPGPVEDLTKLSPDQYAQRFDKLLSL
jgi:hypothetical protein